MDGVSFTGAELLEVQSLISAATDLTETITQYFAVLDGTTLFLKYDEVTTARLDYQDGRWLLYKQDTAMRFVPIAPDE